MDDNMLNKILHEIKAVREEAVGTNKRLDELQRDVTVANKRLDGLQRNATEVNKRFDGLQGNVTEVNKRFDGLQRNVSVTNKRLDVVIERVDGLNQSVVVLQQGIAEARYEVHNIKEILSDRVIWQNDNISIMTKEGSIIYGIINKAPKKK